MDTPSNPAAPNIEHYLRAIESALPELIRRSPFQLSFSLRRTAAPADDPDAPECIVDLSGPDADLLLDKNGALLEALEHVVLKAIRLDDERGRVISFDCKDWRQLRIEELRLMAQVAADRVIDTGDPFTLSPMNPRERRVVHMALKNRSDIRTQSEGFGHERKVVILPTQ